MKSKRLGRGATITMRFCGKIVMAPGGDGCWEWNGAKTNEGYGKIRVNGRLLLAHRYGYLRFVGPIADGLQLDHLCRNPGCVNPDHLEPVTGRENTARGLNRSVTVARHRARTHCRRGHPLSGANLGIGDRYNGTPNYRVCLTCRKANRRRRSGTAQQLNLAGAT